MLGFQWEALGSMPWEPAVGRGGEEGGHLSYVSQLHGCPVDPSTDLVPALHHGQKCVLLSYKLQGYVGSFYSAHFTDENQRHREVKYLVQGHTASKSEVI